MRIYFNRRPVSGPWGGGSKVISSIAEECLKRGHEIFFEEEIAQRARFDLLFCTDPRPHGDLSFADLVDRRNRDKCKLIQRIGDLGTHGKPELFDLVKLTSSISDALVFPSNWAKSTLSSANRNAHVVSNAPRKEFVAAQKREIDYSIVRLVSHHWSNNAMKGFEVYQMLDEYCKSKPDVEFTFVGRKPDNVLLTNHVPPLDTNGLIKELPRHNVYLTASKQEAGANHVLEAMALGLPVLYHKDGGSINEYCEGRGISYDNLDSLIDVIDNRKELSRLASLTPFHRSSEDMAKEYLDIFEKTVL
jgi:glycosyltransferase involved in cell wall biosynthesis